jgi:hypothetical protein
MATLTSLLDDEQLPANPDRPNVIKPIFSQDRLIITVLVLIVGGALIWRFGESVPVMVLVSSAWTLALTFWFRSRDSNGDR